MRRCLHSDSQPSETWIAQDPYSRYSCEAMHQYWAERTKGKKDVPFRDNDIITQCFMYELENTKQYSWLINLAIANPRDIDTCVLNLQASCGVFAGNETFVSLLESSASSSSTVVDWDFLHLSGIVSSSSRSKLLVMLLNMSSIFAITSRVAGRRAEAIEDETGSYGINLYRHRFWLF